MVDKHRGINYICNLKLFAMIGLTQMFDQKSRKLLGYNIYHFIIAPLIVSYPIISILITLGLYFWIENSIHFMNQMVVFVNVSLFCLKGHILMKNSENIWNFFLKISYRKFLSYKSYDSVIFKNYRIRSLWATYIYTFLIVSSLFVWAMQPLVSRRENFLLLKNSDGTFSSYQQNIFNLYFLVSNDTYNDYFKLFYSIEFLILFLGAYITLLFDSFVISMCLSVQCQLNMIENGYKSISNELTGNFNENQHVSYSK